MNYAICIYKHKIAKILDKRIELGKLQFFTSVTIPYDLGEKKIIENIDNLLSLSYNNCNSSVTVYIDDAIYTQALNIIKDYGFKDIVVY
jgi:hypothetical protein